MATNSELIDQAMARLGQRTSTKIRGHVVTEINTTIEELERGTFFPWFLEKTATLSVAVDDTFVALPSDFAIEAQEVRPYYTLEGTVHYLTKRFYGALVGETPTSVKYYAIRGNEFHFRMAADIAYIITLPYYGKTAAVDPLVDNASGVSNLWLLNAKNWVLGEALSVVAALHLDDKDGAVKQAALGTKGKNDVYVYHEARINENQDFEVGGASDGS